MSVSVRDGGKKAMKTFEDKIAHLNRAGYNFHVWQDYGDRGDERGHSKSFARREDAQRHADAVPDGVVYDRHGRDVSE
jgi:hypothetical protein